MPKYDAFGREIGEDTLSGLGSGATGSPAPGAEAEASPRPAPAPVTAAEPQSLPFAPAPEQPQPQPSTPASAQPQPQPQRPYVTIPLRPPRPKRRRRGLVILLLFVLFVFVAPLMIGAVAIFNTVDNATEAVRGGIKDQLKVTPVTPAKPKVAPKGIRGRSLVRKANFAAALRKLSSSELRLTSLRLAPERIDVTLLTRGGRLRNVQVQPGGALQRLGPDSGAGFDSTRTIPFARLDPAAPQRLARRGAAKLHVPVSTLQYLVPTLFSGKVTWAAYFKHARYVLGDAAGRYQRSYP